MGKKKESELTIPNVVREMVAEGEDLDKIVSNLSTLGLELPASKKLIKVSEKKVVPEIESEINKMVAKKEEKFLEASGRRGPRRKASARRRKEEALEKISETMNLVLEDASKKSIVQNILQDYWKALERQQEIKKELMRVLLEAMDETKSRRHSARLRRTLLEIESL